MLSVRRKESALPRTVLSTQYLVLSTQYLVLSTLVIAAVQAQALLAAPPKVNYFFPAGGQRGQSVAVTASGEFSAWPLQVWSDRPGITATCENDKGKLKLDVAADAAPGVYWLRLTDAEGASALRPFVVGMLPETAETEPNDEPNKPQVVEPQTVVNGKLGKNGDADAYAVELKQGQTLVAAMQANGTLGSPMDSLLQVCDLVQRRGAASQATPRVEAFVAAQNHDAVGLDPQIVFTAPRDGRFLVRLFAFPSEPNSTIGLAGGENYIYRLTLTTGTEVENGVPAASVVATDASSLMEPQEVKLPATIGGRLETADDVDAFIFAGAKDQKLRIRAEARSLGFPMDAVISLLDAEGKTIAEQDDTGREDRDPSLDATLPADGQYRVAIRDLSGRGGPRLAYRLTLETPEPDFELSLAADSFVLAADKPLEIPLTVTGRDGFAESVEIRVLGLPAGVTAEPLSVQAAGAASNSGRSGRRRRGGGQQAPPSNAKLILKADPAAIQPGGGTITIEGRFKDEDGELVRTASFPLGLPLTDKHAAVWLTVKK